MLDLSVSNDAIGILDSARSTSGGVVVKKQHC